MFDMVNGKVRARRWPRGRGRQGTAKQKFAREKFGYAQRQSRYIDPQMYAEIVDATEKTPLLPRDMITMMMYGTAAWFTLPDGRKLFPMYFKNEVSNSLDAISQEPGMTLVRGVDGWEGAIPSGGGGDWWDEYPDIGTATPWSTDAMLPSIAEQDGIGAVADFRTSPSVWQNRGIALSSPPAAANWQAITAMQFALTESQNRYLGIYAGNRAADKWVSASFRTNAGLQFAMLNGQFATNAVTLRNTWNLSELSGTMHLRLDKIGDAIEVGWSHNGRNWQQVDAWSLASHLSGAVDEIGIVMSSNNTTAPWNSIYVDVARWLVEATDA